MVSKSGEKSVSVVERLDCNVGVTRVVSDDEISADGCLLKLNRTADTGVAKEIKVRRQVSLNSIRKTLPRDVNNPILNFCANVTIK